MLEIIKIVTPIVIPILTAIIRFFTENVFTSRFMRKAQIFKQIRNEYLEDKIVGYYYLQTYLKIRVSTEEMDFIFESGDAYSILKIIKNCYGKYKFEEGKFKTKIKWKKYIIPAIFYFISAFILMSYIVFHQEIVNYINPANYLILLIFIAPICLPIAITSMQRIMEIRDVLFLQKITLPQKEESPTPSLKRPYDQAAKRFKANVKHSPAQGFKERK